MNVEEMSSSDDRSRSRFSSDSSNAVHRKKSLECSSLDVNIIDTELANGKNAKPFVLYVIEVSPGIKKWVVKRRYSDFLALDSQIRKRLTGYKIPALPPKRYFGSSLEKKFVNDRRLQLNAYLKSIVVISKVWSKGDLVRFLDNDNSSLTFIWNFERVKKMQDVLGTMTIENKNETERLNHDLIIARQQVSVLQSRISRMEMLFLQHATGVASNKLSNSALKTLNGEESAAMGDIKLEVVSSDTESMGGSMEVRSNSELPISVSKHGSRSKSRSALKSVTTADAIFDEMVDGESPPLPLSAEEVMHVLALTKDSTRHMKKFIRSRSAENFRAMAVGIKLKETLLLGDELFKEMTHGEGFDEASLEKTINSQGDEYDVGSLKSSVTGSTNATGGSCVSVASVCSLKSGMVAADRLLECNPNSNETKSLWAKKLMTTFDELLVFLVPTPESQDYRNKIFTYVRSVLFSVMGTHVFPVGSYVTNTYLPDGDIDLTGIFTRFDDESWFVKVNEALCLSAFESGNSNPLQLPHSSEFFLGPENRFTVSNVNFVNAEIKLIKVTVNGIQVDISANQFGSLYAQSFLERINDFVGKENLFKRSVLLIKAWCQYESGRFVLSSMGGVMGAKDNRLTTFSLNVMIVWIFHAYGSTIHHPIQALIHFLRFFSSFDWQKYALTVAGPMQANDLSPVPEEEKFPSENFFPSDILEVEKLRFKAARESYILNMINSLSANSIDISRSNHQGDQSVPLTYEMAMSSADPEIISQVMNSWATQSAFGDSSYRRGMMNVISPVNPAVNLTKTVDIPGVGCVKSSFSEGLSAICEMCDKFRQRYKEFRSEKSSNRNNQALSNVTSTSLPVLNWSYYLKSLESGILPSGGENFVFDLIQSHFLNTCMEVVLPLINGGNKRKGLIFSSNFTRSSSISSSGFTSHSAASSAHLEENVKSIHLDDIDIFSPPKVSQWECLKSQKSDLDFSVDFVELVYGCSIAQTVIIDLIKQIIFQKGSMPVGEIGKHLQVITNSDTISRRLKDQFGGLKKTIESSNVLRVGCEHPFNPTVSLTDAAMVELSGNVPATSGRGCFFHHCAFVILPILIPSVRMDSTNSSHHTPVISVNNNFGANKKTTSSSYVGSNQQRYSNSPNSNNGSQVVFNSSNITNSANVGSNNTNNNSTNPSNIASNNNVSSGMVNTGSGSNAGYSANINSLPSHNLSLSMNGSHANTIVSNAHGNSNNPNLYYVSNGVVSSNRSLSTSGNSSPSVRQPNNNYDSSPRPRVHSNSNNVNIVLNGGGYGSNTPNEYYYTNMQTIHAMHMNPALLGSVGNLYPSDANMMTGIGVNGGTIPNTGMKHPASANLVGGGTHGASYAVSNSSGIYFNSQQSSGMYNSNYGSNME